MKFTTRFLTHTNAEVREAGASVVVELVLIVGETIVSPYIKDAQSTATTPGVTPHLVRLIREKIKAARIAKGGAKLGASAVSQGQSKDAVLLEKKSQDKLDKLKVELEELKEIVEDEAGILNVNELKGPSSIHNSKANSTKAAPSASTPKQRGGAAEKEVEDDPQVCIFCDTRNKEFETNEEVLNNHFFEECAMLCKCPLCATVSGVCWGEDYTMISNCFISLLKIVEVQSLTFHMLAECDDRSLVSQCKNCREAILKKDYSNHTAKGTCKKAIDMSIRCPLCHNDVEEGNEGWRNHLLRLGSGACPANPRKQRRKSVVGEGAKPSASSTTTAALTAPEPPPSLKITAPSQDRLAGISDEEDEEGSPTTPTQASLSKTKQPAAKATTAAASTKLLVSSLKHFHDPSSPPPPRKNVKIILPTDDSD